MIARAAAAGFELDKAVEQERLLTTGTLRFRRGHFQLDLITASLSFEEVAFERAHHHELFGVRLPFPSPEDLILFKVLAGRDKDMLDAVGVARRNRDRLDRSYLSVEKAFHGLFPRMRTPKKPRFFGVRCRRIRRRLTLSTGCYLEQTLKPLCELAEDMTAWKRLQRVFAEVL